MRLARLAPLRPAIRADRNQAMADAAFSAVSPDATLMKSEQRLAHSRTSYQSWSSYEPESLMTPYVSIPVPTPSKTARERWYSWVTAIALDAP